MTFRSSLRLAAVLASLAPRLASAQAVEEDAPTAKPEDILKNIVVASSAVDGVRPLPKIAVHPTLAADESDITLRNVVRRDLELSGEYELLPEPEDALLSDAKVDLAGWKAKGAEALVKLVGKSLEGGKVSLEVTGWLTESPDDLVYHQRIEVEASQVRVEAHRLADALLGALTGTAGGFSSSLTFVFGHGKARRVYVMDGDGHDPHAVSPPDQLAVSPSFGPDHQLYWGASVDRGVFRLFRAGAAEPISLTPRGSVYGIAFSRNEAEVAVSIARGAGIKLFRGPDLQHLTEASDNELAMHPTWSPNGRLAFVGDTKWGTRVFVDGKPISPSGLMASAPVFCRHPDGVRALFTVGLGKATDIVATGENGGGMVRLTQGGTSRYPACSPDGRLVAFFSTRKGGEGPGLYLMRIDGSRAKRLSTLVGDSLRWARVPPGKVSRIAEPK
ncbi:MAG: PD40 domain-containing protein [Deltaproteobacteria bacterium]|nr:PD40 domain-containing protein [Deltaproteobacteria bacterium]